MHGPDRVQVVQPEVFIHRYTTARLEVCGVRGPAGSFSRCAQSEHDDLLCIRLTVRRGVLDACSLREHSRVVQNLGEHAICVEHKDGRVNVRGRQIGCYPGDSIVEFNNISCLVTLERGALEDCARRTINGWHIDEQKVPCARFVKLRVTSVRDLDIGLIYTYLVNENNVLNHYGG